MDKTFTASMFQREGGQWVAAWTRTVDVEAGASARDAGLDCAQDAPVPRGDWELRVWAGTDPDLGSEPDAVVRCGDVLHARGLRVVRSGPARRPWRTSARAGRVVEAMRADHIDPGVRILVTQGSDGVKPAASQDGAVVAFVKQRVEHPAGSVDLLTNVGAVCGLLPGQAVLPAAS